MSASHADTAVIGQVILTGAANVASWSLRDDLSIAVSVVTLLFYLVYFLSMWNNRKRP